MRFSVDISPASVEVETSVAVDRTFPTSLHFISREVHHSLGVSRKLNVQRDLLFLSPPLTHPLTHPPLVAHSTLTHNPPSLSAEMSASAGQRHNIVRALDGAHVTNTAPQPNTSPQPKPVAAEIVRKRKQADEVEEARKRLS